MFSFQLLLFLASFASRMKSSSGVRLLLAFMLGYFWLCQHMTCSYNVDGFTVTPQLINFILVILGLFIFTITPNLQIITILLGQILLLLSDELLISFICLELINICLYLLICTYSSGIKYIITSFLLSSIFVFGILLTYQSLPSWPILIVFLFKLGIFPFHQLTADLYDGLSTNQIRLSLPIKLSILLFITKVVTLNLNIGIAIQIPAISTLYSYTFKRFISLSSASYITLLIIGGYCTTVTNYSIVYFLTLSLILIGRSSQITLLFLSIAGLPPFIGFYFKVYLISELLENGYTQVLFFLISSLILTANYLERSCSGSPILTSFTTLPASILLFWWIL